MEVKSSTRTQVDITRHYKLTSVRQELCHGCASRPTAYLPPCLTFISHRRGTWLRRLVQNGVRLVHALRQPSHERAQPRQCVESDQQRQTDGGRNERRDSPCRQSHRSEHAARTDGCVGAKT